MVYKTSGTCSQAIEFEVEGDVVKSVTFVGGCNGNTQGLSALVEGMKIDEVISRLEGITCGMKSTSCPDQLAKALKGMK
ncbi:MAG: TIGR03905 family TSCPD domain-containing protein [Pseudobutyrivibrio sp.]|nr:TIGR03905 family TSCPD domain-containing protein [Pseudobutyrivibrio sp.]